MRPGAALLTAGIALASAVAPRAQAGESATETAHAAVVVTATRIPQSSFDLPVSIDTVTAQQIRQAQPMISVSESLDRVPGIVTQNRQDYAEGLAMSSRGFGARTPFGIRGIRLLVDGIPANQPDGQGFTSLFDLGSAERIEVMRGPFSALYANAPGGVVQIFTEDGPPRPTLTASLWGGSYGAYRAGVKFGGQQGALNYLGDQSRFHTDGYREHSAAQRSQFNGKFTYVPNTDTHWTLLVDALDQPDAQDPLGLTRAQLEQNPRQAVPQATQYDTRKSLNHQQAGLVFEHRLGAHDSLRVLGYGAERRVRQFLPFSGSFGLSSGGVVDLNARFGGVDARWTHSSSAAGMPLTWTLGLSSEYMDELRKGFVNDLGQLGALRRDENDTAYNVGEYFQAQLDLSRRWSATAGLRHSYVKFDSQDHFITATNPNDSGNVDYSHTSPVLGALYHLTPTTNLYASYGEGFQTPTFDQLAYKPSGASGLNFALRPSTSRDYEVGVKSFVGLDTEAKLALFHIDTADEIVVASSTNGRTSYTDGGGTRRNGLDLSVDSHLGGHVDAYAAYSYLDARFENGAIAGNQLPGAPRSMLYAELRWHDPASGLYTSVDAQRRSQIYVDDQNSAAAGGYTVADWAAGVERKVAGLAIDAFLRVDNLFDRSYVGAVIIADSNARYFEPAPGRNFVVGVTASHRF